MAVKFLTDDWAKSLSEAASANSKFAKASKGVRATFQVNVAGSPEAPSFTMVWDNGQLAVTTGPAAGGADVNLDLDYATMVELSKGTVNGPQAVASGRMKAEGDMEKMFTLGKAMDLLPTIEAGIGLDY
jgi:putative sterol carrier protein